jgi:hypothetical protein
VAQTTGRRPPPIAAQTYWVNATSRQLKIQFVQVGNDWPATQFLRRLEEDLHVKHNITVRFRALIGF